MIRSTFIVLILAAGFQLGAALLPVDPNAFFTVPGKPLRLKFKGSAGNAAPQVGLTAFSGQKYGTVRLVPLGGEFVFERKEGLPAGYYTLTVDGAKFGLLVQEAYPGEPDFFFGIDCFFSWNEITHSEMYEALKLLRRYGVAAVRDRFEWSAIQKDPRVYLFRNRYDENRRLYPRAGVRLLDVHHGAPDWAHPNLPRFPEQLQAASVFWMTLGANWSSCWNAVETWNEPEGGFGANLPADQMMPGAKAMRYGLYHAAPAVKLGAAGFTSIAPSGNYHRTAAKNGLLDNADFVSFHTYGDAESLITLTRQYREWLAANGKSGMPLRLTEVSRVAWDNFRTGEESLKIAAELAMQAAVGRAVGLEQLYFFAYYELKEGNKTFGFLAPDRTPRLSFAAFLQSVRRLGHTRYAGKLRTGNRMIRSARVYTGDRGCVTVLETAGGGTFAPPYPVCRVEGLDGRVIAGNADGSVPLPDPVVYLLSDTVPEELLDTGTPENRLAALAGLPAPDRTPPSPLVLFPHPDFQAISRYSSVGGYMIAAGTPVPVGLDIWNLSAEAQEAELSVDTGLMLVAGEAAQSVIVPPCGKKRLDFTVMMPEGAAAPLDLDFTVESAAGTDRASLAFRPLGAVQRLEVPRGGMAQVGFGGLENWQIRIKDQPWNSRADLDAAFRLSYTDEALTLTVEVEDDRHFCSFPPAEMWKGDSVQIGLQAGKPKSLAERAKFTEYTIGLTPEGGKAWRTGGRSGNNPEQNLRDVPLQIVRRGTLTRYTLTLTAHELGLRAFRPGDSMRLALVVNDNDGAGRKGYLHWADGIGVNKNPEEFNTIVLK